MVVVALVLLSAIYGISLYSIAKLALMNRPIVESRESGTEGGTRTHVGTRVGTDK